MKKCPACYTRNQDSADTCSFCGVSMKDAKPVEPSFVEKLVHQKNPLLWFFTKASAYVKANKLFSAALAVDILFIAIITPGLARIAVNKCWIDTAEVCYRELAEIDKMQLEAIQEEFDNSVTSPEPGIFNKTVWAYSSVAVNEARIRDGKPSFNQLRGKVFRTYTNAINHINKNDYRYQKYSNDLNGRMRNVHGSPSYSESNEFDSPCEPDVVYEERRFPVDTDIAVRIVDSMSGEEEGNGRPCVFFTIDDDPDSSEEYPDVCEATISAYESAIALMSKSCWIKIRYVESKIEGMDPILYSVRRR